MTVDPSEPEGWDNKPDSPYAVSFHADTALLLDLLASTALYGTPLAAVRELVLNAFDAVRERLARERIKLPASEYDADSKWDAGSNRLEGVSLEVFENANGTFIICQDTGVGLDAETITRHLLGPGKAPGTMWQELDRQCQTRGFRLSGRIRRGLGFLSYFMLAEAVKIRSRRDPLCGGNPDESVIFKSTGPAGRTVLRCLSKILKGSANTTVTLRLKKTAGFDTIAFETGLLDYLRTTVVRTPCALHLFLNLGCFCFPAGWSPETTRGPTAHVISPGPRHLALKRLPTTSATLDLITALTSIPGEDLAQSGIHIETDILDFHIPGLATLRCTAPWINYRGIKAMVWATDADPATNGRYTMVALQHISRTAWQGMHCKLKGADLPGLQAGKPDFVSGLSGSLPAWGYLAIDVDLDEPPVESLALNRSSVTLTLKTQNQLKEFCLKSMIHMVLHLRKKHPGTLLAEQMEELEQHLRVVREEIPTG